MNWKLLLLTFISALFSCILSSQQPESTSKPDGKIFGLFTNDQPVEMTLKFDMTTYFRKKPKEEYLKGEVIIHTGNNDSIAQGIRLRTRGEFRNRECVFAPIELNFKKAKFGYSDLDSISKIKLVTQCNFGNGSNVLREYLIYKLFNVLTDTSFRVRLIKVTYVDTGKEVNPQEKGAGKQEKQRLRKPVTQWAFLMEPNEALAKRINSMQVKTTTITQKNIYPFVIDRLALFNYMVGNYDWSIPGQHNVKVFKTITPTYRPYLIAIPYDFDWSGIVNATYAIPAENTGLNSVRERMFVGICRSKETFSRQLDILVSKKDVFYGIINNFEYLSKKDKADIIDFLDTFYEPVESNRSKLLDYLTSSGVCKDL